MKHLLIASALLCIIGLESCGGKEDDYSETSINARADSIVGSKLQQINQEAMDDLDKRMTIEVKAKADSIVAMRTGKSTSPDTTKITPRIADEEIIKKTQLPNVKDSAR